MSNLLNTIKKLNKFSWKINISIIIFSLLMIAFVNVDVGFIIIITLGILNVVYIIISIFAFYKHHHNKGLILSIVNLISLAVAYYIGVLILLEGFY